MTGTNHALTGALIAAAVPVPLVALPLAFGSHFLLDALPHYGEPPGKRKKLFKTVVSIDGIGLSIGLAVALASESYLPAIAGLVAVSPDFFWIYRYLVKEKRGKVDPGPKHPFNQWHSNIQKYERRWGVGVELVWLVVFVTFNAVYTL